MDEEEVERLAEYVYVPIDLNSATREEIMTVPGMSDRMAHEFEGVPPVHRSGPVPHGDREIRGRGRGRAVRALRDAELAGGTGRRAWMRRPGGGDAMIRAVIFRLHLAVAVAAGAVVLLLAATGAILSLEETVIGLAERRYFVATGEGKERLGPEAIAAAAGFAATSLRYRADARAPIRVYEGRDRYARIDPHSGAVLGIGPDGLERFFEGVHNWHRWFNVSGGSVRRARAVTGAVNLAFLFLLLTGPILWIPRPVTRRSLANVILLRRGARGAWRDLNWHQVVGIWSVVPLAVIAATGVTTSYPAVGDRVYPVVANAVPARAWPGPAGLEATEGSVDAPRAPETDLAAVLATAEASVPEWRTLTLNVPRPTDSQVRVEVQGGRAGRAPKGRHPHRGRGHRRHPRMGVLRRRHPKPPRATIPAVRAHGRVLGTGGSAVGGALLAGGRADGVDRALAGHPPAASLRQIPAGAAGIADRHAPLEVGLKTSRDIATATRRSAA